MNIDENHPFNTNSEDFMSIDVSDAFKQRIKFMKPEAHATWLTAAQLMIADIVGVGILTLPSVMRDLGWAMGIGFIILFLPINIYTGLLLWQVRMIYPKSMTYIDMARFTFGTWGKPMALVAGFYIYLHLYLVLGDYVLVIGQSLGLIFYDLHICKPWWIFVGCCCLLPFNQIRLLNETKILCWINMGTITTAVIISLGYLIHQGLDKTFEEGAKTEMINSELDIWIFSKAFSKIAFAYAGQFLYLEILAEMKKPEDFPYTFAFSGPYQLFMYLIVSCVGYYYKGNRVEGMLIDNIGFDIWMRIAAILLFIHILITYLIKGNVVSRALHLKFSQKTVNDKTFKGAFNWFCVTTGLLLSCFLLANVIPFFEELSGLVGSFLVPISVWNIPIMYYVAAKSRKSMKISLLEWPLMIILFLLGLILTITGTKANIESIINNWANIGGPFTCHCEHLWNTCECSPDHTNMECNITLPDY